MENQDPNVHGVVARGRDDRHHGEHASKWHREQQRPQGPRGRSDAASLVDPALRQLNDDPRAQPGAARGKAQLHRGGGRNTASFDPSSTLVRPDMRVLVGPNRPVLDKPLKHDDVVVVPEFFCREDDWSLYYQLVEEMRELQAKGVRKSEWISWHEGAHLISNNPSGSKTFSMIQDKIAKYFGIEHKSVGTRFNWYRDSSDWKPAHHDSAAFNPHRARTQNITVGVSFGSTRELFFLHAKSGMRIYFPQTNGMLFSFGRDVNISWKHGINALQPGEQDGKGRISVILWGLAPNVIEEEGNPPMLTDDSRGVGPYGVAPAPAYHPHVQQQQRGGERRGEERRGEERRGEERRGEERRGEERRREERRGEERRGEEQGRDARWADERRDEHRGLPRAGRGERDRRGERDEQGGRQYDGHGERDGEDDRRGERDASRGDARDGRGDRGPGEVRSGDRGWRGERRDDRDGQRGERREDRDSQRARDREGDGEKGGAILHEEGRRRGGVSIGDERVDGDRRHANGHDWEREGTHAQGRADDAQAAAVAASAAAAVASAGALQATRPPRQGAAAAHGTAAGGGGGGSTACARAPLFSLAIGSLRDASAAAAAAVSNMPSDPKRRSAVPRSRGGGDDGCRGGGGADEGCEGGEGDGRRGSSGGGEVGEGRGSEVQGGQREQGGVEDVRAGRELGRGREVCRNHARGACSHGSSCRYLHG